MGFIVVGRAWVMEEVRLEDKLYLQHITSCVGLVLILLHFSFPQALMVVVKVGCIHQAMVGIICLVDLMYASVSPIYMPFAVNNHILLHTFIVWHGRLVVALTRRCTLVVA